MRFFGCTQKTCKKPNIWQLHPLKAVQTLFLLICFYWDLKCNASSFRLTDLYLIVNVFARIQTALPGAQSVLCGGLCLAWNYDEVLQVLDRHPCVGAVIAGHDHSGGYARSMHGVHHITLEGVIETPLDSVSFATVDIHDRGLMLRGFGRARTAWFPFTDIRAIHGSL